MKEINEDMQMRIFDLLEGNLNEREKNALLRKIESSPVLKREYELMSKTYLIADDEDRAIIYTDKATLYHRTGIFISFSRRVRYSAAASVALLASGFFSWYYFKGGDHIPDSVAHKSVPALQPRTGSDNHSSAASQAQGKSIDGESNPQSDYNAHFTSNPSVRGSKKSADSAKSGKSTLPYIPPVSPDGPVELPVIAVITGTPDTMANAPVINGPVPFAKKRSLSYKLLQGGRAMLTNLQLPDIKIITERKSDKAIPTVKMAIKTYRTDVIATLIE